MRGITVALLLLVVLAAARVAQVPDDKLIVPGQWIGAARLDMTIDDIIRVLGGPSQVSDRLAFQDDALPAVLYYWQPAALIAATRDRVKVECLMLDATVPWPRTPPLEAKP